MLEIKDGKKILTTPISAEDLKDIHVGDIVYLNGSMTTCRDVAHRRLVEGGRELPVDVRDAAIFHAGPIIRPLENDKFEMVSVGPTTSMRMEKFEKEGADAPILRVSVWPEPYSFDCTPEEEKEFLECSFDADGIAKGVDWINERYESELPRWKKVSRL